MNRGLPVLEAAGGLDSWRRPEGLRPLGTRMACWVIKSLSFEPDLLEHKETDDGECK